MPVSDVQLASIDAERYADPDESHAQVRIDHNSTVTQIEPQSDDVAEITFRYTATYGNLGSIKLEGRLLFQGDAEAVAAQWQDQGDMPDDVASQIHTAVMQACVTEAVSLAKDLELPPPIPLPQVQVGEQGQQQGQVPGQGQGGGPEVA